VIRNSRRWAAVAAATAAVLASVLLVAGPAQAHNRVIATNPASGATLTALPEAFTIQTDLPMLAIGGSDASFLLDVSDAQGRHYGDGCVKIVDDTMSEQGVELGAAGEYTVDWQLVSQDGHPISGSYTFQWAPPAGAKAAKGHATTQRCGKQTGSAPSDAATSQAGADDQGRGASVPLGDVLWIGGAVLAVLVAGGVTLLIVTRRRPGTPSE
jgi:copper resistance protein C